MKNYKEINDHVSKIVSLSMARMKMHVYMKFAL